MNQFIVTEGQILTPQQIVMGTMGISLEQLINDIRENRNGRYDCLYKSNSNDQAA